MGILQEPKAYTDFGVSIALFAPKTKEQDKTREQKDPFAAEMRYFT